MIGAPMPDPQVATSRTNPNVTVTHTGPVFRVERFAMACADGSERVKDVVRHPGAVTVIAVRGDASAPGSADASTLARTPCCTLVLVRNRRVAVDRWLLEFCAGKLERGEDPAVAAGRELEEETGYSAGRIEKLGAFFTSPGFTDEIMHVFLATELRPVPQRLEPGEEIEVVELDEATLRAAIAAGEILDGKTLGAYLLWSMKRATGHGGGA
jgi:ADP-ribose pyrophosphatase